MMRFVIWIANHALWISLIGAVCTIVVRFEKFFPRWLHTSLLFVSLFVTLATPLLGMLKKSLDDQWKTNMQQQIASALEAAEPKPFKERLKAFFDSVDPAILAALRNGKTKFHGFFYQDQLGALRSLADDPEAQKYLRVEYGSLSEVRDRGVASEATFELDPAVLQ